MVIREPIVPAVGALTFALAAFVSYPDVLSGRLDYAAMAYTLVGAAVGAVCAVVARVALHHAGSLDKTASLDGEVVRGLTSPLAKLPLTFAAPQKTAKVDVAWFAVPEVVSAMRVQGLAPQAWFNQWLTQHEGSPYQKLAKDLLCTIGAAPDFPAGPKAGDHNGRSLLSHTILVAFCASELARTFTVDMKSRGLRPRNPSFDFTAYRDHPMIMVMALAHDIGKLKVFVKESPGDIEYTVTGDHDKASARMLTLFDAYWDISTAERDTLHAVVCHYHAESLIPVEADGRPIDDLRHAMVRLLIAADTQAGHLEASSAYTTNITPQKSTAVVPTASPTLASVPTSSVAPASTVTAAPPPTATVVVTPASKSPPVSTVVPAVASGASAADKAVGLPTVTVEGLQREHARVTADLAVEGISPTTRKERQSKANRLLSKIAALEDNSVFLDVFLDLLHQPKVINQDVSSRNLATRVDDLFRQRKLLYVHEHTMRSMFVSHPKCPPELRADDGRMNNGSISRITTEVMLSAEAKGWLWNPITDDHAQTSYLPQIFGFPLNVVYADRAKGVFRPDFAMPRTSWVEIVKATPKAYSAGAGFILNLGDDPALAVLAALPEYGRALLTGRSIAGARGLTVQHRAAVDEQVARNVSAAMAFAAADSTSLPQEVAAAVDPPIGNADTGGESLPGLSEFFDVPSTPAAAPAPVAASASLPTAVDLDSVFASLVPPIAPVIAATPLAAPAVVVPEVIVPHQKLNTKISLDEAFAAIPRAQPSPTATWRNALPHIELPSESTTTHFATTIDLLKAAALDREWSLAVVMRCVTKQDGFYEEVRPSTPDRISSRVLFLPRHFVEQTNNEANS